MLGFDSLFQKSFRNFLPFQLVSIINRGSNNLKTIKEKVSK